MKPSYDIPAAYRRLTWQYLSIMVIDRRPLKIPCMKGKVKGGMVDGEELQGVMEHFTVACVWKKQGTCGFTWNRKKATEPGLNAAADGRQWPVGPRFEEVWVRKEPTRAASLAATMKRAGRWQCAAPCVKLRARLVWTFLKNNFSYFRNKILFQKILKNISPFTSFTKIQ